MVPKIMLIQGLCVDEFIEYPEDRIYLVKGPLNLMAMSQLFTLLAELTSASKLKIDVIHDGGGATQRGFMKSTCKSLAISSSPLLRANIVRSEIAFGRPPPLAMANHNCRVAPCVEYRLGVRIDMTAMILLGTTADLPQVKINPTPRWF